MLAGHPAAPFRVALANIARCGAAGVGVACCGAAGVGAVTTKSTIALLGELAAAARGLVGRFGGGACNEAALTGRGVLLGAVCLAFAGLVGSQDGGQQVLQRLEWAFSLGSMDAMLATTPQAVSATQGKQMYKSMEAWVAT